MKNRRKKKINSIKGLYIEKNDSSNNFLLIGKGGLKLKRKLLSIGIIVLCLFSIVACGDNTESKMENESEKTRGYSSRRKYGYNK